MSRFVQEHLLTWWPNMSYIGHSNFLTSKFLAKFQWGHPQLRHHIQVGKLKSAILTFPLAVRNGAR